MKKVPKTRFTNYQDIWSETNLSTISPLEEALPLVEAIDQTYFGQLGSQVSDFNRLLLKLEENDG